MYERHSDDLDREAILLRRQRFIGRMLQRIDGPSLTGPKTKLMVAAVPGLATACPCLSIGPPPSEETGTGGTAGDETDGTETDGTETNGTETAGETTEAGETSTDTGTDSAM